MRAFLLCLAVFLLAAESIIVNVPCIRLLNEVLHKETKGVTEFPGVEGLKKVLGHNVLLPCFKEFLRKSDAIVRRDERRLEFIERVAQYRKILFGSNRKKEGCQLFNSFFRNYNDLPPRLNNNQEQVKIEERPQDPEKLDDLSLEPMQKLSSAFSTCNGQEGIDTPPATVFDEAEKLVLEHLAAPQLDRPFYRFERLGNAANSVEKDLQECGCSGVGVSGESLATHEAALITISSFEKEENAPTPTQRKTWVYNGKVWEIFTPARRPLVFSGANDEGKPSCWNALTVTSVRQLHSNFPKCNAKLVAGKTYLLSGQFVKRGERMWAFDVNPCAFVRETDYIRFGSVVIGEKAISLPQALSQNSLCRTIPSTSSMLDLVMSSGRKYSYIPTPRLVGVEFDFSDSGRTWSDEDVGKIRHYALNGQRALNVYLPESLLAFQVYESLFVNKANNLVAADWNRGAEKLIRKDGVVLYSSKTQGHDAALSLAALNNLLGCNVPISNDGDDLQKYQMFWESARNSDAECSKMVAFALEAPIQSHLGASNLPGFSMTKPKAKPLANSGNQQFVIDFDSKDRVLRASCTVGFSCLKIKEPCTVSVTASTGYLRPDLSTFTVKSSYMFNNYDLLTKGAVLFQDFRRFPFPPRTRYETWVRDPDGGCKYHFGPLFKSMEIKMEGPIALGETSCPSRLLQRGKKYMAIGQLEMTSWDKAVLKVLDCGSILDFSTGQLLMKTLGGGQACSSQQSLAPWKTYEVEELNFEDVHNDN